MMGAKMEQRNSRLRSLTNWTTCIPAFNARAAEHLFFVGFLFKYFDLFIAVKPTAGIADAYPQVLVGLSGLIGIGHFERQHHPGGERKSLVYATIPLSNLARLHAFWQPYPQCNDLLTCRTWVALSLAVKCGNSTLSYLPVWIEDRRPPVPTLLRGRRVFLGNIRANLSLTWLRSLHIPLFPYFILDSCTSVKGWSEASTWSGQNGI
jgi:hypothetical protein